MPRLPPAAPDPDSKAGRLLAALPLNVLRTMAHAPEAMLAFQDLGGAILSKTSLPGDLRELAILRVGWMRGAAYEVHHHERIGRAAGMSEAQIAAARTGDPAGLAEADRLALAIAEAVERGGTIEADLFAAALGRFGPQGLVELVLAAGFYGMVSRFLVAFDVAIEDGPVTLKGIE